MTSRQAKIGLAGLLALALALRIAAWSFKGGFHYPDEIFQQLEPAHILRTGQGWLPWEFGRGLRSWVMPWFYAGLLETLSWVGIQGHDALRAVNLHNALWSACMVPALWRMGRAMEIRGGQEGEPAGFLAALLMACWPTALYFAPHALMDSPSMIFLTWGYAFWLEERVEGAPTARRAALWMGLFFGLAGVVRFTSGLHMLVPLADLALRRRWKALGWLTVGAAPGLLLLGAVDWLTWGRPFHSAIEHFTYNYLEGGASDHGVSPWHFYLTESFGARLGPGIVVVAGLLILALPRAWPALLTVAVPTLLLSTVAHKEERFLMHNWPLLMGALAVGLAALWRRASRRSRGLAAGLTAAMIALMLTSNLHGTSKLPWRWRAGIFEAQRFVGHQPDASGLLLDDRQHLNGGQLALDRAIPQVQSRPSWWGNPLFNYAALRGDDPQTARLLERGWTQVATFEDIRVLRRPPSSR